MADRYQIQYFETSAKADVGVQDLMKEIFEATYKYKKATAPPPVPETK